MYRFVTKILTVSLLFIAINIVLFLLIPMDKNAYVCEYNHKVELMEYGNFFNGGNGEPETYPVFVKSTNWRYVHQLNVAQCSPFLYGS